VNSFKAVSPASINNFAVARVIFYATIFSAAIFLSGIWQKLPRCGLSASIRFIGLASS